MAELSLFGKIYPLVGPSEFTLGELNDCENLFNATFNDEEINSRKLSAILYVSIRRVDKRLGVEDIRNLTAVELEEIHTQLQKWESEGEDVPPAEGVVETPSSENGSSNSSVSAQDSSLSPTGNPV